MTNVLVLTGRLGKDPIVKEFENGDKSVSFSIANSEVWKDKEGEKKEKTYWFNVRLRKHLASMGESILKKGMLVTVTGKMKYDTYGEDKKQFFYVDSSEVDIIDWNKDQGSEPKEGSAFQVVQDDLPF